jgi:RNA polymerase sigma-70 factor, ECF subfamily
VFGPSPPRQRLLYFVAPRNNGQGLSEYAFGARVRNRDAEWSDLMRAANNGDAAAYARLLQGLAPPLRAAARRGLRRAGLPADDAEDIVQEILLAIHLKRHTWDARLPIGPWIGAIARNKLVDALRRQGRRVYVSIEAVADSLADDGAVAVPAVSNLDRHLGALPDRQRAVVRTIAVEGASIKQAAACLKVSEGAVRVALHRGLAALAARMRETNR